MNGAPLRGRAATTALWILVAMTLGSCGCINEDRVREYVAQLETCPPEKIQVKVRPDIAAASYVQAMPVLSTEIANDPARLAYLRQQQTEMLSDRRVFEFSGCGFHQLVACRPLHANGRIYINQPDCVTLPAGSGSTFILK
jgi:hypothetical protein